MSKINKQFDFPTAQRLPFRQFVKWALMKQVEDQGEGLLSGGSGLAQWRSPMWPLAQRLKGYVMYRGLDWDDKYAWRRVNSVVQQGWPLYAGKYVLGELGV